MPSLSISNGDEKIVTSKPETLRVIEAAAILGAIERMEAALERKAEIKAVRDSMLRVIRIYGAQHLDADGYPKETARQALQNKL